MLKFTKAAHDALEELDLCMLSDEVVGTRAEFDAQQRAFDPSKGGRHSGKPATSASFVPNKAGRYSVSSTYTWDQIKQLFKK